MDNYNKMPEYGEDYVVLALLLLPERYAELLPKISPKIFAYYPLLKDHPEANHPGVIWRLKKAFRTGGIDAVKEEALDIYESQKYFHDLMEEYLDMRFHDELVKDAIRRLEKRYKEIATRELIESYNNGKISSEELEESLRNLRLELRGQRWTFTLNDEKDELLEEDEEEGILLPFIKVEAYPSDLILITAQTKSGKTTLAMNMALELIKDPNRKALYVTYEVGKKKLFRMFVGIESGKNWKDIELEDKEAFLDKYGNNLSIKEGVNLDDLLDFLLLFHPDVFVIDYDQLVPTKGRFESEERRLSHIIQSLKNVATQIQGVGIILSQINEEGKARYSREKEHAASIHVHLEKQENSKEIEYEIKLNRWGRSGQRKIMEVNWETRQIIRVKEGIPF